MKTNEKQIEEIREYYNKVNIGFDHTLKYYRTKRFIELTNELLQNKNYNMCLDIGCATGVFTELAVRKIPNVVAFDISEEMLKVTKEKIKKLGIKSSLMYIQGNAERLPFRKGVFDLIILFRVLEYLSVPEQSIQEISRIIQPKGSYIGSVPSRYGLYTAIPFNIVYDAAAKTKNFIMRRKKDNSGADNYYRNFYTPESIRELFKKSDLSLDIFAVDYLTIPRLDGFIVRKALARITEKLSELATPLKALAINLVIKGKSVKKGKATANKSILACPFCKKDVELKGKFAVSKCGLKYLIHNNIIRMQYPLCPKCNSITCLVGETKSKVQFICRKCGGNLVSDNA